MAENRFTVFDVMERKGMFKDNTANMVAGAKYKKQEYPKMFYHPTCETFVTVQAVAEMTPFGPRMVGEQREIVNKIAENLEEEKVLRAEGWHDHPSKAIAVAIAAGATRWGKEAPPISSAEHIEHLESELERLKKQLADLQGATPLVAVEPPAGPVVDVGGRK